MRTKLKEVCDIWILSWPTWVSCKRILQISQILRSGGVDVALMTGIRILSTITLKPLLGNEVIRLYEK